MSTKFTLVPTIFYLLTSVVHSLRIVNFNVGKVVNGIQLNAATATKAEQSIGWDSHKAIDAIPESLVRTIDGNESMRRKFEALCRTQQVNITRYEIYSWFVCL